MINIIDISKKYDDLRVLEGVSLTIQRDKPLWIMGRSGIGKTTLLNIIMGFEMADGGKIEGIENLKISAVFQEDRLCENISPIKNILIACENVKRGDIIKAFEAVGLKNEDIIKPVKTLSGGMKRRVAIVRCVLAQSDFMIMDEPFKGLDMATRGLCTDFIKNNLGGRYMLAVTHDIKDVEELGGELREI